MSPPSRTIRVGPIRLSNEQPLVLIAGPCVIEGESFALRTAEFLAELTRRLDIPLIYKSSFDKANRTSSDSFRGPGLVEGLEILVKVKNATGLPVITDLHEAAQASQVAQAVDMVQTPAFLCRQTDFIRAAAAAGKPINLKKGQFLSPHEMLRVAAKAESTGNPDIALCERGFAFGYNNLVVDMRSLTILAERGHPVVFDATHSVQLPGGGGAASGGERRFVAPLSRAAVAVGLAALFLETHPDPDQAPCDGPNMVPMAELEPLLRQLKRLDEARKLPA